LILDSVFFSGSSLEDILENFVEPELAEALSTISNESWEPALKKRVSERTKIASFSNKGLIGGFVASEFGENSRAASLR